MSRLCVMCSQVEAVHPEVSNGYIPHSFRPADEVRAPTYEGPERRKLVRRMDDRVALVERAMEHSR